VLSEGACHARFHGGVPDDDGIGGVHDEGAGVEVLVPTTASSCVLCRCFLERVLPICTKNGHLVSTGFLVLVHEA
jgi:hypothetical protein